MDKNVKVASNLLLNSNRSLILCLLAAVFAVLKFYSGSNTYLIVFLIIVSFGIVSDKVEKKIEYLLFFIPWVYVIKFQLTQFSLFVFLSALYIICCVFYLILKDAKISKGYLLSFLIFGIYTITIPLIRYGNIIEILGFLLNYTSIAIATIFINNKGLIRSYVIVHAMGLLTSSIVRYIGYYVNNIDYYFQSLNSSYTFFAEGAYHNRFSGMDRDPNYFAIQILIAISCLFVCIYFEKQNRIGMITICLLLIVFGVLSYSKMFLITLLILGFISIFILLRQNIKFALNYIFILTIGIGITSYYFYDYIYNLFLVRFGSEAVSISTITTGRIDTWLIYIRGIFSDISLLLFGQGYGAGLLNNVGAHNFYLTFLYYMGIIGVIVTLCLFVNIKKVIEDRLSLGSTMLFSINSIPLFVLIVANVSLDSFVMDFLPYQLLLIITCLSYSYNKISKD